MKIKSSDALFGIQIVFMVVFTAAQFMRMVDTVQGVSPAWLVCAEVFCLLSLGLAYKSWKSKPSRATLQLFATHAGWSVSVGLLLIPLGIRIQEVKWGWYDTASFALVFAATVVTVGVAISKSLGVGDPLVRGVLASIYRGIPHLTMAYKILLLGGQGLASATVWTANITACIRIAQLYLAVRDSGWDRAKVGLAIGEGINESTWILVTLVWLVR